jgi:hypothetical protein
LRGKKKSSPYFGGPALLYIFLKNIKSESHSIDYLTQDHPHLNFQEQWKVMFIFFKWDWGLNAGFYTCKAGSLSLKSLLQSICPGNFGDGVL